MAFSLGGLNMRPHALLRAVVLMVAALTVLLPTSLRAQRAIPDDNLAYPVLFTTSANAGSGFYYNSSSAVYFATAKHVIFDEKGVLRAPSAQLLSYSRDPKDSQDNLFVLDLTQLQADGRISAHPKMDVAVIKVATIGIAPPEAKVPEGAQWIASVRGVSTMRNSPSGILGVSKNAVKKYDEVLVGNDIVVFGYPTSIGLQQIPQIDPIRPLLRKGIVSGKNPSLRTIIVDVPSFPGNSGGPVLQIIDQGLSKRFEIIGVVSQFVPFDNSRFNFSLGERATILNSDYSVLIPMDYLLDLIDDEATGSIKK